MSLILSPIESMHSLHALAPRSGPSSTLICEPSLRRSGSLLAATPEPSSGDAGSRANATSITQVGSVTPGTHAVPAGGGSTLWRMVISSHVGAAPFTDTHAMRTTSNSPREFST